MREKAGEELTITRHAENATMTLNTLQINKRIIKIGTKHIMVMSFVNISITSTSKEKNVSSSFCHLP